MKHVQFRFVLLSYSGFRYLNNTKIDQLDACQLASGRDVFFIKIFKLEVNTMPFTSHSPYLYAWEMHLLKSHEDMCQIKISFDVLEPFIEMFRQSYNSFSFIKWIVADKTPYVYVTKHANTRIGHVLEQETGSNHKNTDDKKVRKKGINYDT